MRILDVSLVRSALWRLVARKGNRFASWSHCDRTLQNDLAICHASLHLAQPLHRYHAGRRHRQPGREKPPSNGTPARKCAAQAWLRRNLPIVSTGQNNGRCRFSTACVAAGCARHSKGFPSGSWPVGPRPASRRSRAHRLQDIHQCIRRSADPQPHRTS